MLQPGQDYTVVCYITDPWANQVPGDEAEDIWFGVFKNPTMKGRINAAQPTGAGITT